mgnify:CR=1 FL=1
MSLDATAAALWRRTVQAYTWFRAFRQTRPFWGGLWLIAGGWVIVSFSARAPIALLVTNGVSGFGGWLTGGGMMVCGVIAWLAPAQRLAPSLLGLALSIGSLIASNLGGLFLGMLLGILGSAMILGWGPKRPIQNPASDADPAEISE